MVNGILEIPIALIYTADDGELWAKVDIKFPGRFQCEQKTMMCKEAAHLLLRMADKFANGEAPDGTGNHDLGTVSTQ